MHTIPKNQSIFSMDKTNLPVYTPKAEIFCGLKPVTVFQTLYRPKTNSSWILTFPR